MRFISVNCRGDRPYKALISIKIIQISEATKGLSTYSETTGSNRGHIRMNLLYLCRALSFQHIYSKTTQLVYQRTWLYALSSQSLYHPLDLFTMLGKCLIDSGIAEIPATLTKKLITLTSQASRAKGISNSVSNSNKWMYRQRGYFLPCFLSATQHARRWIMGTFNGKDH